MTDEIRPEHFFTGSLVDHDPAIAKAIGAELKREQTQIELIASENLVSRAVLPLMIAAGRGSIVNTASTAGLRGAADMPAYSASKHAVIGLTKGLALEAAPHGVRVNCICPGSVEGEMTRRIGAGREATGISAALPEMAARVPLGRQGLPSEIATTAAYLACDAASFVTGAAYVVDGGRTAR